MRFLSSIKKSRFIAHASNKYLKEGTLPAHEIFKFITAHKDLSRVAKEFNATVDDIENLFTGMLASPHIGHVIDRGHFVPVSGLLFADTLSYLLRSQRGQVSENVAYMEVGYHFSSGQLLFEPEIQLRKKQR